MSTVADVIDRVFREYLRRPTERPTVNYLAASMTSVDTTAAVDTSLFGPEDEEMLGPGAIVEVGLELMTLTSYDSATGTLTLARRGALGTSAAAHAAGTELIVSPEVTRQAVFDNLSDAIASLYPRLFTVQTFRLNASRMTTPLPSRVHPREVVEAKAFVGGEWRHIPAYLIRQEDAASGYAIGMPPGYPSVRAEVICSIEPQRPTSETDELSDLGVDESWMRILVVDTAAGLLHSPDVDATTTEYLTRALEETVRPLGQVENLAVALERYRERLVQRASERVRTINRPRMVYQDYF